MTQEVRRVVWLRHGRRGQYIAHFQSTEGLTLEEAEAKWEEAAQSHAVLSTGSGESLELAVALPRETTSIRGKTSSHQLSLTDTVDTEAALDAATKRMRVTNMSRGSTDSVFEDVGGAAFRANAASSSGRSDGLAFGMSSAPADAPPISLNVSGGELPWAAEEETKDKPLASLLMTVQAGKPVGKPSGSGGGSAEANPAPRPEIPRERREPSSRSAVAPSPVRPGVPAVPRPSPRPSHRATVPSHLTPRE